MGRRLFTAAVVDVFAAAVVLLTFGAGTTAV